MTAESIYEDFFDDEVEKSEFSKRTKVILILILIAMSTTVALCMVFMLIDFNYVENPREIIVEENPRAEELIETSSAANLFKADANFMQKNGTEIPIKFLSGTTIVEGTSFLSSFFIKIPTDLIENKEFKNAVYGEFAGEIEDAYQRISDGEKVVAAEVYNLPKRKYENLVEVIYKLDFITGRSSFFEMVMTMFKAIEHYDEDFRNLVHNFRYNLINVYKTTDNENEIFEYEVASKQ
jgi:hypothetical protein